MTVRDMIAEIMCELDCMGPPDNIDRETAEAFLQRLCRAPDSVRLELAAMIVPWRPIETAPKDCTYCLIWWPELSVPAIGLQDEQGRWYIDGPLLRTKKQPSHWLPLPTPPSGEVK